MPESKNTLGSAPRPGRGEGRSTPDGDYEVGYRKPPKQHRFRKGTSGNPKGRPKKVQAESVDVLPMLHEKVAVRRNGKTERMSAFEASLHKLVERALKDRDASAGIRFVRICEKYKLIEKAASPRSGGVVYMTEDEWAQWEEHVKRQRELIERDREQRRGAARS